MREQREAREKATGKKRPEKPQEQAPLLFPDMHWVWASFCFLSDRRGVSANGPVPITMEAMNAYCQLTKRRGERDVEMLLRFVPALDRVYLHDFYEKQRKEMEKQRKKAEASNRKGAPRAGLGRR